MTAYAPTRSEIHAAAHAATDTHTGFRDDRGMTR